MTKRVRIAVLALMCAMMGVGGIALAGGASAAGVATSTPRVAQVAEPRGEVSIVSMRTAGAVRVTAAKLHCQSHTGESKPVKGKVVVPKNYCYDPHKSGDKSLHDYCTKSPDSVFIVSTAPFGIGSGTVDFRGPCARHDMCLDAGHSHSRCDGPLLHDMKKNCVQRFAAYNPARYECYSIATTYYLVIKVKTKL